MDTRARVYMRKTTLALCISHYTLTAVVFDYCVSLINVENTVTDLFWREVLLTEVELQLTLAEVCVFVGISVDVQVCVTVKGWVFWDSSISLGIV